MSVANGTRPNAPGAALDAKAAFVEHFRAGWSGGAQTLIPRFLPGLLDPDVVMTQPLLPPARGHDGFAAFFAVLFGAIPDLRGEVRDWRPTGDGVEIDFTLRGTLGGEPFALPTTDRIVLRDGRVLERHARPDPRALAATIVRHPLAAMPLLAAPLRAQPRLDRALAGLALGRIALGAPSRLAPRAIARTFGAARASSPQLDYMTRVFGIRAIALGAGWLSSEGAARRGAAERYSSSSSGGSRSSGMPPGGAGLRRKRTSLCSLTGLRSVTHSIRSSKKRAASSAFDGSAMSVT